MAQKMKAALLQRKHDDGSHAVLQRTVESQDAMLDQPEAVLGVDSQDGLHGPDGLGGSVAGGTAQLQRAYGNQYVQRLSKAQRSAGDASGGEVAPAIETRIEGARGGGQTLGEGTRAPFERSLGADFSDVRVHTGGEAGQLNRSLGAKAFTTGNDIFFGEGQYDPESPSGQQLLAHELTHVVQQGGAPVQTKQAQPQRIQRAEEDESEEKEEEAREEVQAGADPAAVVEERREEEQEEQQEEEGLPSISDVIEEAKAEAPEIPSLDQVAAQAGESAAPAELPEPAPLPEPDTLPAGVQAKMEVSAADDPYEREADELASRVVETGVARSPDEEPERASQSAVQPSRPMQLQRTMIQRDDLDTSAEDDAIKQAEEEDREKSKDKDGKDKNGAPSEEELRQKETESRQEGSAEGEQAGAEQGKAAMAEAEDEVGDAQADEPAEDGPRPAAPELTPAPELPGQAPESKPVDVLDADQEAVRQQAPIDAETMADLNGWAASAPANWDEETAFHELFAMAAKGGPDAAPEETAQSIMPMRLLNLQRFAAAGHSNTGASGVQRDLAGAPAPAAPAAPASDGGSADEFKSKASTKWSGGEFLVEKKDDDVIPVPRHENVFAQAMIGDTASKAAETINKFASIRNETNPFGVMAAMLEGVIKVMEIVTAIIGIITLILSIVAVVLYAVAAVLAAAGAALLALFGAGAALIAIAAKLTAIAAKITAVVAKISAVVVKILIVRIALRAAVLVLRGLDVLFMYLSGADMKDIKKKLGMMGEQAIGILTDGVQVALAVVPAKIQGTDKFKMLSGKVSSKLSAISSKIFGSGPARAGIPELKAAALGLLKPTVSVAGSAGGRIGGGAAVGGINEGKKALDMDQDEAGGAAPGVIQNGAEEEQDEEEIEFAPPPHGVEEVVEGTAAHMADAGQEKTFLVSRIATIDEILVKKIQWGEDMNLMQAEIASEKTSLDASDQLLDNNMATADQFTETAKQGQGPAAEAAHYSEKAGGSLHGMEGQMNSSMKHAEEEKPGQMGNVDKGQMMGGPGQGKQSSDQAGDVLTEGISEAAEAKAESQEQKDRNAEIKGMADDASGKVSDTQSENEGDVKKLVEEKEACLARLAEIESKEVELSQLHDEAVGEGKDWADEHASKREKVMAGA